MADVFFIYFSNFQEDPSKRVKDEMVYIYNTRKCRSTDEKKNDVALRLLFTLYANTSCRPIAQIFSMTSNVSTSVPVVSFTSKVKGF